MRREHGPTIVRRWTLDDSATAAALLARNLDHLAPWMPWARPEVADATFQRERLTRVRTQYDDDRADWDFAVETGGAVIGAVGLLVRDGCPRVWYWIDRDRVGEGHAARAAQLATDTWRECRPEPRLEIRCDEGNPASAAIPRRLGYRLERVATVEPETTSETGRMMIWVVDR